MSISELYDIANQFGGRAHGDFNAGRVGGRSMWGVDIEFPNIIQLVAFNATVREKYPNKLFFSFRAVTDFEMSTTVTVAWFI